MRHARKGTASGRTSEELDSLRYIRETITELETTFDQEALWLICGPGIFSVDAPAQIDSAVDRLNDREALHQKRQALFEEIQPALPEDKHLVFTRYDDTFTDEVCEVTETAYMLGIAVGRRLGSLALRPSGRARKGVA